MTRRVIVLVEHAAEDGTPEILRESTLPLTGEAVVDRIITDLAVIDVTAVGLHLAERGARVRSDELRTLTDAPVHGPVRAVSHDLRPMSKADGAGMPPRRSGPRPVALPAPRGCRLALRGCRRWRRRSAPPVT
ncbi:hypothetical protein ACFSL4_24530 [Streptomyces caeni]|uniref:Uncharacterized protein n=1 Tax=Streptomyces caeni TaxID=2307231 RepID=A0ABW4IXN4_9ACTN